MFLQLQWCFLFVWSRIKSEKHERSPTEVGGPECEYLRREFNSYNSLSCNLFQYLFSTHLAMQVCHHYTALCTRNTDPVTLPHREPGRDEAHLPHSSHFHVRNLVDKHTLCLMVLTTWFPLSHPQMLTAKHFFCVGREASVVGKEALGSY